MFITIFNLNYNIIKVGCGITNNENTTRKFFKNAKKMS
jgi:hypothetical protein